MIIMFYFQKIIIIKANYNYHKNYNFDNFIRTRMTDHNKITFAIKYLLMSHLG